MTVQAFLNAILKSKPKPKVITKRTEKFTKGAVQSLLEEAQSKVEAIKSGKQKPIKIDDFSDEIVVDTITLSIVKYYCFLCYPILPLTLQLL